MCEPEQNNVFRNKFKYYKSKNIKPSLKDLLNTDQIETGKVLPIQNDGIKDTLQSKALGLHSFSKWKYFSFTECPGLVLIRNPFTAIGQRYWIRRCLEEYPKKPNKINIDVEMKVRDWWSECQLNRECDKKLQKKLRWTTLGYHHNWDTKIYSDDNQNVFPEDLAELTDVVAKYLKYDNFKAEAAIVNYYHMDSTLSAHTDHSEVNLEAPLFSFSFGQSAIFLIGGKLKSIEPTAILIQSGDVVIMSKESRLCYHAVPKILPAASTPWNNQEELIYNDIITNFNFISSGEKFTTDFNKNLKEKEWSQFESYIQESRINMNVRQVLKEGQNNLNDTLCNNI